MANGHTEHTVGKYAFKITGGVPVPEPEARSRTTANPSPFPAIFDALFAQLAKGKPNAHSFVPDSFWTDKIENGGRGAKPDAAAKKGYVKTKLRDAFKGWQSKGAPNYDHLTFASHKRDKGDVVENEKLAAPGFSFWLIQPAPKRTAPSSKA